MKKKIIVIAFLFISTFAFADSFLMLGAEVGHRIVSAFGIDFSAQLSGAHYFGNYGKFGIGFDVKPFYTIVFSDLEGENPNNMGIVLVPSIQFRSPSAALGDIQIKLYPLVSFEKELSEKPCVFGGGMELFFDLRGNTLGKKGAGVYLTGEFRGKSLIFSIGPKFYLRGVKTEKKFQEEKQQQWKQEEKKREEIQKAEKRRAEEREWQRQRAETEAIQSGSIENMRKYTSQYGYSTNIITAIEKKLSGNENANYKVLGYFDNPYAFDKYSVYFCGGLKVEQWISEYSFMGKTTRGKLIYVETMNIKAVNSTMHNVFLEATGTLSYEATAGNLNVVPKFTLLMFD